MQPRVEQDLKNRQLGQSPRLSELKRTHLDLNQKVEIAAQALGRAHEHGSKTKLARNYGVSRPPVYAAQMAAAGVLATHFDEKTVKVRVI